MECQQSYNVINICDANEELVDKNDRLSMTSVNNQDSLIFSESQIIDNNFKEEASSTTIDPILDDNTSLSTRITITNDDVPSSMNHPIHQENVKISDRLSPINGPGLAKPLSMTKLNSFETKRLDAALEKNLETIATQGRRTTTKTSQLTQNDFQLFDNTKTEQRPREMTPDSINEESIQNGHFYPRSAVDPYTQTLWSPTLYPFPHQHPGIYLPYPPSANALPTYFPSYDPLLIEKHFTSSYYAQQQAAAARLLQEQSSLSDNFFHQQKQQNENLTKSPDIIPNGNRRKNLINFKTSLNPNQHFLPLNENLSRLSPDLLSDGDGGGTNDAESIISIESIKSNTAVNMPVVEDGLSDSENSNSNEQPSPIIQKTKHRHQTIENQRSTNSLLIPSHKQQFVKSNSVEICSTKSETNPIDYDTDEETDKLLSLEHRINAKNQAIRDAAVTKSSNSRSREVKTCVVADPENSSVLIEGVLFRCRYLGSTQLPVEVNPTKISRMAQAQEAVELIKAPYGESQPSVEVDLFISAEKIMVLNTDLEDILMDHSLRSISYIADIGDLVVLMAKRRYILNENNDNDDLNGTTTRRVVSINQKMICHVFESEEAQPIAHAIGQAFQVAYIEFLKANGIDDPSFTRDIDYQEVLDQQEISIEELNRFSKRECQKEAIVTKAKNEPLGIVIVESGWGSMLPTVVVANMMPGGPAARGGHLNIGDQIISVNGISMVGLPLSSCQTQIKNMKHLTTIRLLVIPCPPVVEVLIRRPDTKYQLGFSVQNGIICSLLRGGIAERGGVRVGHRIIEINGQSVVATSHERIVNMLSNSVGELRMKTMPTQMYRLLTGQETPIYI